MQLRCKNQDVYSLKMRVDADSNKKITKNERVKYYTIKVKCPKGFEE